MIPKGHRTPFRSAAVALIAGLAVCPPVSAQGVPGKAGLIQSNPALAKVSSHLLRARQQAAAGMTAEQITRAMPGVRMTQGLVYVSDRKTSLSRLYAHGRRRQTN